MRAGDALGRWSLVVSRRSLVVGKDRIPRRHFVKPKGKDPSTPELVRYREPVSPPRMTVRIGLAFTFSDIHSDYSLRSATMGSSLAARRAGM